MPDSDLLLI